MGQGLQPGESRWQLEQRCLQFARCQSEQQQSFEPEQQPWVSLRRFPLSTVLDESDTVDYLSLYQCI